MQARSFCAFGSRRRCGNDVTIQLQHNDTTKGGSQAAWYSTAITTARTARPLLLPPPDRGHSPAPLEVPLHHWGDPQRGISSHAARARSSERGREKQLADRLHHGLSRCDEHDFDAYDIGFQPKDFTGWPRGREMSARRRNVAPVGSLPGALVVGPRKSRALDVVFSGDAVVDSRRGGEGQQEVNLDLPLCTPKSYYFFLWLENQHLWICGACGICFWRFQCDLPYSLGARLRSRIKSNVKIYSCRFLDVRYVRI